MTCRVAQISDTHLSRDKPFFVENFELVAAAVADAAPDLVLNTGDVSLDGATEEGDLLEARRMHAAIPLAMRFIPGNHDVGECHDAPPSEEARISAASRERYVRHFGEDYWQMDVPGWRFVAVDALLVGSDLEAAAAQLDFIARAVAAAGSRRIALFVHKPLFDASPGETAATGRFVNAQARSRLLAALAGSDLALVASGHVHQYRSTVVDGVRHVWAPSTGFIIPDERQPRYGEKDVGYVEHRFEPDGRHEARYVRVPGLKRLDINDFLEAYRAKR
jgi:3',5'-cyclic AMP phosphodiesterase CpdA